MQGDEWTLAQMAGILQVQVGLRSFNDGNHMIRFKIFFPVNFSGTLYQSLHGSLLQLENLL